MQPVPNSPPVPWSEVLAHVQAAVDAAVAEVSARAPALDAAKEPTGPSTAGPQQALQRAWQNCQAVAGRGEGAAARVAEVDAALAQAEEALRQWLRATQAARDQLATWVDRAVVPAG
jgi:hypothetical protein